MASLSIVLLGNVSIMAQDLRRFAPIILSCVSALGGCASWNNSGAQDGSIFSDAALLDRTFQIQDVAGKGVIDSSYITLRFGQGGQFSGSLGCNNVFGSYERVGAELKLGALGATRKLCAPALMNQEQAVLDILSNATGIEHDAQGALLVRTDDGRRLRGFESTQP